MLMFAFNSSAASIYSFTAADVARLLVLFTILHDWSEKIMQKNIFVIILLTLEHEQMFIALRRCPHLCQLKLKFRHIFVC